MKSWESSRHNRFLKRAPGPRSYRRDMRRALVPLIAFAALLANAPQASAKQWCVPPASGCADVNVGTLASALTLAQNNPGHDEIRLGDGTYSNSSGFSSPNKATPTNTSPIKGG